MAVLNGPPSDVSWTTVECQARGVPSVMARAAEQQVADEEEERERTQQRQDRLDKPGGDAHAEARRDYDDQGLTDATDQRAVVHRLAVEPVAAEKRASGEDRPDNDHQWRHGRQHRCDDRQPERYEGGDTNRSAEEIELLSHIPTTVRTQPGRKYAD